MTKIFWLPITYEIIYRQKQHRSTDYKTIRETVPLSFNEVSQEEAPVVLRIEPAPVIVKSKEHQRLYGYQAEGPYTPEHAHDIRSFEGKLMRPMMLENGTPATEQSISDYEKRNDGIRNPERFRDYPYFHNFSGQRREAAMAEIYEYHRDDRDARFEEAQVTAAKMISIDGVFYKEAIEPVIQLCADGGYLATGKVTTGPIIRVIASGVETTEKDAVLFRADEMDLAMRIADEISVAKNQETTVEGDVVASEPEYLQFRPEKIAYQRLLSEMKRFASSGFGYKDFDTDNIRIWCDAIDNLRIFGKGETEFAEVAEKIKGFIDTFPGGKDTNITRLLAHTARNSDMPSRMEEDLADMMMP